jgi:ABC-type ATPase with predicted acetyltransferase domain
VRKRREFFHITKHARTYDRWTGRFTFDIAYKTATKITPRTIEVAEGFGLGIDEEQKFVIYDNVELKIGARDIVYITGDSGSGKSVLLKVIKQDLGYEAIDVADIQPDPDKPLIETVGKTLTEGLELLSKAGLNDAFLFIRRFGELSDGQKYRYKIAKLIESRKQWWIADEFCATLDRDSARIVSFNIQKLARNLGKAVVVATTHTDLFDDLNPSVHIHKRYGKEITVNYYPNQPSKECSLVEEMRIEEGTTKDWRELACFHYRSHRMVAPRKIFCMKRGEELCGVIVYCYPPPACFGRRLVLPRMTMKELNQNLSIISRVVVHPKYRTIGLGVKLVRETLPLAGTQHVEMPAVMAKYNPFAEKAGMKKIVEQLPPKEALKITRILQQLGFNTQLLSSDSYVLKRLQGLNDGDVLEIKEAFAKHSHTRFLKSFVSNLPFGKTEPYKRAIANASLDKLAGLIKICGFLLQTKVYLFWGRGTPA